MIAAANDRQGRDRVLGPVLPRHRAAPRALRQGEFEGSGPWTCRDAKIEMIDPGSELAGPYNDWLAASVEHANRYNADNSEIALRAYAGELGIEL